MIHLPEHIQHALIHGLTCDITTTGAQTGQQRRIEIWYFVVDRRVYLTGTPGPRAWLANLRQTAQMIFHLKEGASADLVAHGQIIDAPAERQRIMAAVMAQNSWFRSQPHDLATWVAGSPLVEVIFQ